MVFTPAYVALVWEEQTSSVVRAEKPHCLVHTLYWYHGLLIIFQVQELNEACRDQSWSPVLAIPVTFPEVGLTAITGGVFV